MAKTSERRLNTVKSLSAKVTEATYDAVLRAAGEKKPSVWLRELIEAQLTRGDVQVRILEELWALRFTLLNTLPTVAQEADRETVRATIETKRHVADTRKADKARALLRGER